MELPSGFFFATIDVFNSDTLSELTLFLKENYIESDDELFRFQYKSESLAWNY